MWSPLTGSKGSTTYWVLKLTCTLPCRVKWHSPLYWRYNSCCADRLFSHVLNLLSYDTFCIIWHSSLYDIPGKWKPFGSYSALTLTLLNHRWGQEGSGLTDVILVLRSNAQQLARSITIPDIDMAPDRVKVSMEMGSFLLRALNMVEWSQLETQSRLRGVLRRTSLYLLWRAVVFSETCLTRTV